MAARRPRAFTGRACGGQPSSTLTATFRRGWRIRTGVDGQAEFLGRQQVPLLRAAYLLTGDHAAAQDLAQEVLVKAPVAWRRRCS